MSAWLCRCRSLALSVLVAIHCSACDRQYPAEIVIEFGSPNDKVAESDLRERLLKNDPSMTMRAIPNTAR
jgi:hypothetical protein